MQRHSATAGIKRKQALAVLAVLLSGSATALAWLQLTPAGATMSSVGDNFVQLLSEEQRAKAIVAYDAPARTEWHYIPKNNRKGLQLADMNDAQRQSAHSLLQAALSASGYGKATRIMQLEILLKELEKSRTGTAIIRDPQRYYFTIFGQPRADSRWGLSVEGHHLSLNFVVDKNQLIATTPTFFGANPAVLKADYGEQFKAAQRVLGKEEDLAFALLGALTPEQRRVALVDERAPNDVRGAMQAAPPQSTAAGLAAAEMSAEQQALLRSLIAEYAQNLPGEVAAVRLAAIEGSRLNEVMFSWRGADKVEAGHDYRVQGPTFLIEFNNTQPDSAGNLANHIHSVWHDLRGNFALPVAGQ